MSKMHVMTGKGKGMGEKGGGKGKETGKPPAPQNNQNSKADILDGHRLEK